MVESVDTDVVDWTWREEMERWSGGVLATIGQQNRSTAKSFDELLSINTGLFEHAVQCANFHLAVERNDTAAITSSHDNVAAALADLRETESLQSLMDS